MEFGLNVEYNGKKNIVMNGECKDYPIGGLICEYARFEPTKLKQVILNNPYYNELVDENNIVEAMLTLYNELFEKYGSVVAGIVITEFSDFASTCINGKEQEIQDTISSFNSSIEDDKVKQFILENSGYIKFGIKTIGQIFLTAYCAYADSYCIFKHLFNCLVNDKCDNDTIDKILNMYVEDIQLQNIGFIIGVYDGGFHSIYTITSSISLLLFELAHMVENGIYIVKCKNCGKYFVPFGRADSIYCGYPSLKDNNKTCREVGAKNTRIRKMKSDITTSEYRRLYMRLIMQIKRHPENEEFMNKLKDLSTEMKVLRKRKKEGLITSDDILEWLHSMDDLI